MTASTGADGTSDAASNGDATARQLVGFGVLGGLALAGEAAVQALAIPLPGAALGMLLLIGALLVPGGDRVTATLAPGADSLIAVLPLLLVPLAVGVLGSMDVFADTGIAIAVTLVLGWLATFSTAALLMSLLCRRR